MVGFEVTLYGRFWVTPEGCLPGLRSEIRNSGALPNPWRLSAGNLVHPGWDGPFCRGACAATESRYSRRDVRTFWITLAIVWGLLLAGAVLYASQKGIP